MSRKFVFALAIFVALHPLASLAQSPAAPRTKQDQTQPAVQSLERLLAPIALYPDPLLGNVLMASTRPLEVVKAARWLKKADHASLKGDRLAAALEAQDWDPSVKALVAVPDVLRMMDEKLDWTEQLGAAFKADPSAVMRAVQGLRKRAHGAGVLVSGPQAAVSFEGDQIAIAPPDPQTLFVPSCAPTVYGAWPGGAPPDFSGFFPGAASGAFGCNWIADPVVAPLWGWSHVNWQRRQIDIDRDRFAALNRNRPPPHEIGRRRQIVGPRDHDRASLGHALRALRFHPGAVATDPARGLRGRFRPAAPIGPVVAPAAAPHFAAPHVSPPVIAAPHFAAPHFAAPPHIAPPAVHARP